MTNTTHTADHAVVVIDPGDRRAARRRAAVAFFRARIAVVLMPAFRPRAPLAGLA